MARVRYTEIVPVKIFKKLIGRQMLYRRLGWKFCDRQKFPTAKLDKTIDQMIQVKVFFYPSPSPHLKVCIWALIVLAMSWWSVVYFVQNIEFSVTEFLP